MTVSGRAQLAAGRFGAAPLLALVLVVGACGGRDVRGAGPDLDLSSVVGPRHEVPDSAEVAIYVDGTVSMAGYVAPVESRYIKFLEELESAFQTGWSRTYLRFHKFGKAVREIDRPGFLAARQRGFYADQGMSSTTSIDRVIDCTIGPRVVVVVTDLFQREGDINSIVGRIKEACFRAGVAVGVLAIKSEFDGTVYDAKVAPYPYRSDPTDTTTYRPFYALMFGARENIERLVQSLQTLNFVSQRAFVLVADHVVRDFRVKMAKSRDSRDINARRSNTDREFVFDIRKGGEGGTLTADVSLDLNPACPPIALDQLRLTTTRVSEPTGVGARSGTATQDFRLAGPVTGDATSLHIPLALTMPAKMGAYVYDLTLTSGAVNGFGAPTWVSEYSSENPSPDADANKTLNLEKFVLDLRRAASSVHQPNVARWRVTVDKKG